MEEKLYTAEDLKKAYDDGGREMAEFISYRMGVGKKVVRPDFESWKKKLIIRKIAR